LRKKKKKTKQTGGKAKGAAVNHLRCGNPLCGGVPSKKTKEEEEYKKMKLDSKANKKQT